MSTEEQIARIKEELALQSESYLKGVVDFVKWTSTVASAAMLWIGSNLTSMTGSLRIIVIIALACLASSLVTAICTVKQVLNTWGLEWECADAKARLASLRDFRSIVRSILGDPVREFESAESEIEEQLWEAIHALKPLSQPRRFNVWLAIHMILLLAGLLLYALAQALTP